MGVLGLHQQFRQATFELAAVDEAGEGIVGGVIGQQVRDAVHQAHVVEHHDRADEYAVAVENRRRRILDHEFGAVAPDEHGIGFQADHAAFAQTRLDGVGLGFAAQAVDDMEYFVELVAARLRGAPAGQFLGHRVEIFDPGVGVGRNHGIADRIQRDLGHFLLAEQLIGRLPHLGQTD